MTVVLGQTTFLSVLAKGPKGRKFRSASELRESSRLSLDSRERSRGPVPETARSSARGESRKAARRDRREPDPVDPAGDAGRFILYVEGARDREILGCWARRVDAGLARCVEKNTVILGGRRPARAVSDFLKRGGLAAGYRGLIVLDRDDHPHAPPSQGDASGRVDDSPLGELIPDARGAMPEAGLELFVWSLRHIESYLLVPAAIRRMLGLDDKDRRVERSIDESLIASDESATGSRHSALHAKRFLGAGGSLSEALGTELRAGEIARAMRLDELHADVRLLFERIGTLSGLAVKTPEVVIRTSRRP